MYDPVIQARREGTVVAVAATGQALDTADAKRQLRIEPDDTWQDTQIAALCIAAQRKLESDLGFALLRTTYETRLDGFPLPACGEPPWRRAIWLGAGDSPAVTSITYLDGGGARQTLAAGTYTVARGDRFGVARVLPVANTTWPTAQRQGESVCVTWQSGWASAADVAEDLMMAMRLLVGHWFENREAEVVGTISTRLQLGYEALIEPWRPKFLA